MRIAYLVAGAGGMYCGSCLRDNRVVSRLIAQGRDVVLIPLYTPIRTDEPDADRIRLGRSRRVYLGGINVYLRHKWTLFRHLPGWLGRILDARFLLRVAARLAGDGRPERLGALTVSVLAGEEGPQRLEVARLVDGLRAINPDIVVLPNLMFVGMARSLKSALNVPILCTLSGEDIFLDGLPEPYRQTVFDMISDCSGGIDGFVAVTNYYAQYASARFGLAKERVHVVRMGVRVDDLGETAQHGGAALDHTTGPPVIGYLARICPEKGLANLCEALVLLRRAGRECRVRAAGYLARSGRPYLDRVRRQLREEGAADAFEYVGEVDRAGKLAFLRSLHIFSVPTVYHESKGLYILEAMACGVPVVQPRHGSFPELIEATGGGVLYDPDEPGTPGSQYALADAISRLMDEPVLRARLAARGRAAVCESFNDEVMAEQTWALCKRLCAGAVE
jgi:glycosyltransferase involved in cell wall biosynthesis